MAGIKKENVEKVKQIIKDLKEKGLSNVEIAKQYGVSESFVRALSDSTEKTEWLRLRIFSQPKSRFATKYRQAQK